MNHLVFSIIIPAYNEEAFLPACLASIKNMDFPSDCYEIIVVDNGSSDRTREIAASYGATVFRDDHKNVSGLRNFGAKNARGRILAFVDADCVVSGNWLRAAEKYFDDDRLSAWGAPPIPPENSTWVQKSWYLVRKKEKNIQYVEWLESMNLFVRKDQFLSIGGFNESLVTCEDVDLSYRLLRRGKILSDQDIIVTHFGEARTVRIFMKKEIWRGHGNLRGMLSHGFLLKEIPSLMIPVIFGIVIPLLLCISLFTWDLKYLLGALALFLMPNAPIVFKMRRKKVSPSEILKLLALMQAYYLARAIAIFKWGKRA